MFEVQILWQVIDRLGEVIIAQDPLLLLLSYVAVIMPPESTAHVTDYPIQLI